MDKIYSREQQVLENAEKLLCSGEFESAEDKNKYALLYEEYKTLLKQTMKMVRMSDRIHLELKKISKELEVASQLDALTGLYNRKYFHDVYLREWKSAIRSGSTLALFMIDIDYFKQYNDIYGHLQGDICLKSVTGQIQSIVNRPRDIVVRFGGDEFIMLLPETGIVGATALSEEIVAGLELIALEHKGSAISDRVTVSIGVAVFSPNEETTMDALLQQADLALYEAKKDGRNCFRIYNPAMKSN